MVLGGSTNAVLHSDRHGPGVRHRADASTTCRRSATETPLLADFKPSGKYVMEDLHQVGGTPAVMKMLLEAGLHRRQLHDRHRQDAWPRTCRTCRA